MIRDSTLNHRMNNQIQHCAEVIEIPHILLEICCCSPLSPPANFSPKFLIVLLHHEKNVRTYL